MHFKKPFFTIAALITPRFIFVSDPIIAEALILKLVEGLRFLKFSHSDNAFYQKGNKKARFFFGRFVKFTVLTTDYNYPFCAIAIARLFCEVDAAHI